MYTHNINDFDSVIVKTIREMQRTHNCLIFIESDETDWYITVFYMNDQHFEEEIKMTSFDSSKFAFATAIRRYFRNRS